MKNKGFTLIEIIGAIVILSIIAILAFATYTNSLKGFRENYYEDTERTLEKAGKEFFSDNRNYRPNKILNAQEVTANILQSKNYLNSLVDYNGDSCSARSYVMVVKEGKDDYSYHACLICEEDGYDNTKDDLYCDRTWLDPTKVTYGLGTLDDIFIYKGTSRDELRDLLELPVSYVRRDDNDNIIATRVGLKEGGDPTMLPADIDVVNTEVKGDYYVTYKYGVEEGRRKVTIYEHDPPTVQYRKQNIVATNLSGGTKTETTTYNDGEWAQSIIVNLNSQSFEDPTLTTSRFQWNKDGRWEDFCTSDPCERKVSEEMNQLIQFRLVDSKGHISKLTSGKQFQIDNTKPICTLEMPTSITIGGTLFNNIGDNSWYVSNNLIRFSSKEDQKKSDNLSLVSGIVKYNIQISTANLQRDKTVNLTTHTQDGENFKYIGYVEDKAENFNTCETPVFKKDATKPNCELKTTGTLGTNSWFTNDVTVSFKTSEDATSKVAQYGIGSYTGNRTVVQNTDTSSVTYTGYIKDNAGNTNTCSISFKRDATKPSCEITQSGTKGTNNWYVTNVGYSITTHTDNLSGVAQYGLGSYTGASSATHTSDTASVTYTGYIKDNAGNTNTCTTTFKKDATKPTCSISQTGTKGTNDWYVGNVTVNMNGYSDNVSGVAQYGLGSYTGASSATHSADTTGITYTGYIKDNAGNTNTCTSTLKKDSTAPSCGDWSGESTDWTNQGRTIRIGCSDATSTCVQDSYSTSVDSGITSTKSVTLTLKDKAGNTKNCTKTVNVYVDTQKPTCTNSGDSTTYIGTTRTIYYGCKDQDGGSQCNPLLSGGSKAFSTTTVTSTIASYIIQDNAGNQTTCSARTANVYVDTTGPSCVLTAPAAIELGSTGTATLTCTDGNSGVANKDLSASSFTISGNATISSVTKAAVTGGYKYSISISGTDNGDVTITLNSGEIKDVVGNNSNTPSASTLVKKKYIVTYKPNGGSGSDQTQGVYYGDTWTTAGSMFSQNYKTQDYWYEVLDPIPYLACNRLRIRYSRGNNSTVVTYPGYYFEGESVRNVTNDQLPTANGVIRTYAEQYCYDHYKESRNYAEVYSQVDYYFNGSSHRTYYCECDSCDPTIVPFTISNPSSPAVSQYIWNMKAEYTTNNQCRSSCSSACNSRYFACNASTTTEPTEVGTYLGSVCWCRKTATETEKLEVKCRQYCSQTYSCTGGTYTPGSNGTRSSCACSGCPVPEKVIIDSSYSNSYSSRDRFCSQRCTVNGSCSSYSITDNSGDPISETVTSISARKQLKDNFKRYDFNTTQPAWTRNSNLDLYMMWKWIYYTCSAGYYLPAYSTSCALCIAGYYCPGTSYHYDSTPTGLYVCPDGTTSPAGASAESQCVATSTPDPVTPDPVTPDPTPSSPGAPSVQLFKYEANVTGSACGVGDKSGPYSTLTWTCNGAGCTPANCRLYAIHVTPPSDGTISKVKITFNTIPDHHVQSTNTYEGAVSSLPTFKGKTYFPDTCPSNDSNCENGHGTNNNFFKDGGTVVFRFRPCKADIKGTTLTGTVTVTYSDESKQSVNFSYSVSS